MNIKQVSRLLAVCLLLLSAMWHSPVAKSQTLGGNDVLAGNAVAQSLFQSRLNGYLLPIYNQPLISSSLIASLAKPGPDATESQKKAADRIANSAAAAVDVEMRSNLLELSARQQMLQRNGFQVGGARATIQAGGLAARSMVEQQQLQFFQARLAKESEYYRTQLARFKERLEYRNAVVKRIPTSGSYARSGMQINSYLDLIKPTILEYSYDLGVNSAYEAELRKLKISPEDIAKIRLQLDTQGAPVIFTADKGSVNLGQLPFVMNRPELTPLIGDIETRIKNLVQLNGEELLTQSGELSKAIKKLTVTCDRVIGTKEECRERSFSGNPDFKNDLRNWRSVQDYITGLRGIVNRLNQESSAKFLSSSSKTYDSDANGNQVLPFIKFIVQNNCKVAAATNGDEDVYARFLNLVAQMHAIINN